MQSFSTDGEYSGATTFVCGHSPDRRRGFCISFLDMGSYLGFAAGGAVVSALQLSLGQEQIEAWGWRIPFLVVAPLAHVPDEQQGVQRGGGDAAEHHGPGALALCIPFTGLLSDRIGRRRVLWIGAFSTVVFAVSAFLEIAVDNVPATLLGLALIAFPVAFSVPNLASALPALFPTEYRYSAMGIAYNLVVAVFGGTAPFIIASLIELTGNDMMPAYYLMSVAAVAAVAIRFLPEGTRLECARGSRGVVTRSPAGGLPAQVDTLWFLSPGAVLREPIRVCCVILFKEEGV